MHPLGHLELMVDGVQDKVHLKSPRGAPHEVKSNDIVLSTSIAHNTPAAPADDGAVLRADIDTCGTIHAPPRDAVGSDWQKQR